MSSHWLQILCTVIVYCVPLVSVSPFCLTSGILIIHEHYISTPFTNCNVPHSWLKNLVTCASFGEYCKRGWILNCKFKPLNSQSLAVHKTVATSVINFVTETARLMVESWEVWTYFSIQPKLAIFSKWRQYTLLGSCLTYFTSFIRGHRLSWSFSARAGGVNQQLRKELELSELERAFAFAAFSSDGSNFFLSCWLTPPALRKLHERRIHNNFPLRMGSRWTGTWTRIFQNGNGTRESTNVNE